MFNQLSYAGKAVFLIVSTAICINGQNDGNSLAQQFLELYISSPYEKIEFGPPGPESVPEVDRYPDYNLTAISERCPKNSFFASFDPTHADAVRILTTYLIEQGNEITFREFAQYVKTRREIHPKIWFSAVTTARLAIPTPSAPVNSPSSIQLFPTSMFPAAVLENDTLPEDCVYLDERFGEDNGVENKLWYFREDVALNAHHWYWHLINPFAVPNITQSIDRRGELFYFFHHELMARYHWANMRLILYIAERLSNGLEAQRPVDVFNTKTVLEEGYNSHLHDGIAGIPFANRLPNRNIYESIPEGQREHFMNVTRERNRVLDAINQGGVLHEEGFVELNAFDRINILGDITEASSFSINTAHYSRTNGFHSQGHNFISLIDVPANGTPSVMAAQSTTMRDVAFYRWHLYVDIVFQSYKLTHLKAYTPHGGDHPLVLQGIHINNVQVVPESVNGVAQFPNLIQTYWKTREFDLGSGLDFIFNRTLNVCAKHLDHQEFKYLINIENAQSTNVLSTVRIFLAPRFKSLQARRRYTMLEQRSLFFHLDSFQTMLHPGNNVVVRNSIDSTVTAGWPKSIREIAIAIASGNTSVSQCDCGFPHHLLLPKGSEEGMVFDLFVMATNALEDQVQNVNSTFSQDDRCVASPVYCGIQGRKYPDSKPMGYPFDRKPYTVPKVIFHPSGHHVVTKTMVENLEEYVRDIPNMHASQIVIQHVNEFRDGNLKYKIQK